MESKNTAEYLADYLEMTNRKHAVKTVASGIIPVGFPDFRRGGVTLIAALPWQGKTSFLLSAINNILIKPGVGIAVYLPGTSQRDFVAKLAHMRSGQGFHTHFGGKPDNTLLTAMRDISNSGLYISGRKSLTTDNIFDDIQSITDKLKGKGYSLDAIFVDPVNAIQQKYPGCGIKYTLEMLDHIAKLHNIAVVCTLDIATEKMSVPGEFKLRDLRAYGIDEERLATAYFLNQAPEKPDLPHHYEEKSLSLVWSDMLMRYGTVMLRFNPRMQQFLEQSRFMSLKNVNFKEFDTEQEEHRKKEQERADLVHTLSAQSSARLLNSGSVKKKASKTK